MCFLLGLIFFIPCIDSIVKVDVRTKSFDVPPQEVSCVFDHCSGVQLISPKSHVIVIPLYTVQLVTYLVALIGVSTSSDDEF